MTTATLTDRATMDAAELIEQAMDEASRKQELADDTAPAWQPADVSLRGWEVELYEGVPHRKVAVTADGSYGLRSVATLAELSVAAVRDDAVQRGERVRARIYMALRDHDAAKLTDLPVDALRNLWESIYGYPTRRSVVSNLVRHCRGAIANANCVANLGPKATRGSVRRRDVLEADLEALRAAVYHLTMPDACKAVPGAPDRTEVRTNQLLQAAVLLPAGYVPKS